MSVLQFISVTSAAAIGGPPLLMFYCTNVSIAPMFAAVNVFGKIVRHIGINTPTAAVRSGYNLRNRTAQEDSFDSQH